MTYAACMALPVNIFSCQVRINMASGITADAATNTFHFRWDGAGSPIPADFDSGPYAFLDTFYSSLGSMLSASIDASNIDLKIYEAWQPVPRVPVYINTLTPLTKGGTAAPPELAMVLSFQGAPAVGVPQARRRNRIFFGPLGFVSSGSLVPFVQQANLRNAGLALLNATQADPEWTWVAASSTYDTVTPVVSGWVDNAWDIQRRRGWDATERIAFP